jgi:hypothetical protein
MKTIKIYSQQKPLKINGSPLTCEVYTVNSNRVNGSSMWYSELDTNDYFSTRSELEDSGYAAYPASSKEIENNNYTIFKETV